jgi:hypothetical protein
MKFKFFFLISIISLMMISFRVTASNSSLPIAYATYTTTDRYLSEMVYFPQFKEAVGVPHCINNGNFMFQAYGISDSQDDDEILFPMGWLSTALLDFKNASSAGYIDIFLNRVLEDVIGRYSQLRQARLVQEKVKSRGCCSYFSCCSDDKAPAERAPLNNSLAIALITNKVLTLRCAGTADFVVSYAQEEIRDHFYIRDSLLKGFNNRTIGLSGNEDLLILASGGFWAATSKDDAVAYAKNIVAIEKRNNAQCFESVSDDWHFYLAKKVAEELFNQAKAINPSDTITLTVILFPKILSIVTPVQTPLVFPHSISVRPPGAARVVDVSVFQEIYPVLPGTVESESRSASGRSGVYSSRSTEIQDHRVVLAQGDHGLLDVLPLDSGAEGSGRRSYSSMELDGI